MATVNQYFGNNPEKFLNDQDIWTVVDNDLWSVSAMTDAEVEAALIQDILMVTMVEIDSGKKIDFDHKSLFRNLEHNQVQLQRVKKIYEDSLFVEKHVSKDSVRIYSDKITLQKAMDFCGVWYGGFMMSDGTFLPEDTLQYEEVQASVTLALDKLMQLEASQSSFVTYNISTAIH